MIERVEPAIIPPSALPGIDFAAPGYRHLSNIGDINTFAAHLSGVTDLVKWYHGDLARKAVEMLGKPPEGRPPKDYDGLTWGWLGEQWNKDARYVSYVYSNAEFYPLNARRVGDYLTFAHHDHARRFAIKLVPFENAAFQLHSARSFLDRGVENKRDITDFRLAYPVSERGDVFTSEDAETAYNYFSRLVDDHPPAEFERAAVTKALNLLERKMKGS